MEERQATMKSVGQAMKGAAPFTSAQTPFDAAKVKALMDTVAADAKKLQGLYPTGSGADPKTEADPKIWTNKADFNKRLTEMANLASAAGKTTLNGRLQGRPSRLLGEPASPATTSIARRRPDADERPGGVVTHV